MSSGALSTRNVTVSEPGEGLIDVVDVDEHLKARVRTDLYADQLLGRVNGGDGQFIAASAEADVAGVALWWEAEVRMEAWRW